MTTTGLRAVLSEHVERTDGEPPALDASQQRAVEAARTNPVTLVTGAPGTGKSTTALAVAVDHLVPGDGRVPLDPSRVLVLAATRRGAGEMRDRLAGRAARTVGQPLVRTAASVAHGILARRASAWGEPAPTLVSGPEQDRILAELIEGHLAGEGVPLDLPPSVPAEALRTRGFRDELRDVLMRAAERGLDPVALDELGERYGRTAWRTCARLFEEYRDVMSLRQATPDAGARVDPASVVHDAIDALTSWDDEVPEVARPRWDLVVVDDYQEATQAVARLLAVLHADGARLVLVGDPDAAVQGFRGAVPALVARSAAPPGAEPGAFGAHHVPLERAWRHGPDLRAVTRRVAQAVAAAGTVAHRRAGAVDDGAARGSATSDPVVTSLVAERNRPARVALLAGPSQEHAYIARTLRAWHLLDGVPWEEMAVVTRSGGQVSALQRALIGASVPVSVLGSQGPLRDEPAVRPLLDAVEVADGRPLDVERALGLLLSPVGGLDAVSLRRLRRVLRGEEIAAGGGRSSDTLLVEVLDDPALAAQLPAAVRRGAAQVAAVLARGREAAARPGADAQTVLWAVWDATALSARWRSAALAGGSAGMRADRDLDAVMALSKAAERFVDRNPRARASAFVDHVRSQDLPADSLAASGGTQDAVAVLTPAGAAGREWRAVVVAGVQEGVWPDLRLRDSLLGAQTLVDAVAGIVVPGGDSAAHAAHARRAVLSDEVRAFLVAVSRAREHLLVTAVEDTESFPSVLVDLVDPVPDTDRAEDEAPDARRRDVPEALDLRGLVLRARAQLHDEVRRDGAEATSPHASEAAAVLARLAEAEVPGADPAGWYGVHPVSSTGPTWEADAPVPVSPSKVESVSTCALRWALETAGGRSADALSQSLGSLIHSIAEEAPTASFHELAATLDRRWPELGLAPGWPERVTRTRARAMVERLARHFQDSGEVLAVEARFTTQVGRAVLSGSVDRLVRQEDGTVLVEDLKTGAAPSKDKAVSHPQLGAYQVALAEGAFHEVPGLEEGALSAGAQLVHVNQGKDATLRTQPALHTADDPRWAHDLVEDVAGTMASACFEARINPLCGFCPVRRSCPLQTVGRTLGQEAS
ncbi:ATP-dependent helicase [Sanguibacter hominis ATCC BAA-789]|uniref:DNA 3'-5' helicase n=1 Tax=Sanguibacter hominis ATCC BAA-789 TaxID=1312740 RepID=A0A9X5FCA1_9MICO|nr:ATP-dependent DNA helicase [Sanguibacter hominis]NKX92092.1 ATP-dependent helicase [Sanguibacter hominis ATCC BAA-789]